MEPYLSQHTEEVASDGYVIPYADSPLDTDKIGRNVYIDILNHAKEYVYIMTPYLILDSETEHALRFAAERGVDIRIIMPGKPDKAVPYALAKTYYKGLITSGVKIYEYSPDLCILRSLFQMILRQSLEPLIWIIAASIIILNAPPTFIVPLLLQTLFRISKKPRQVLS